MVTHHGRAVCPGDARGDARDAARMSAPLLTLSVMSLRLCFLHKDSGIRKSLRGVCVFWCSHICQDLALNTEVWITFLALSCLSFSIPVVAANDQQSLLELRKWIDDLRPRLHGCEATLYAPRNEDVTASCTGMTVQCFLLELNVVMFEKDIPKDSLDIPWPRNDTLLRESSCPPCEYHDEANSTVFLQRFQDLLTRMLVQSHS